MNLVNSRCFLVLFVYFSSAVLVIVDGQSTTDDDDTDKYENNKLIDIVTELRAEQFKSRAEQVKSANAIADLKSQLQGRRKLSGRYGGRHTNPER